MVHREGKIEILTPRGSEITHTVLPPAGTSLPKTEGTGGHSLNALFNGGIQIRQVLQRLQCNISKLLENRPDLIRHERKPLVIAYEVTKRPAKCCSNCLTSEEFERNDI